MRDSVAPWPESIDGLGKYIESLVERQHDYGTCVYAMSLAATAAFQYVAGKLGCTGFQASLADLDILRRTRQMKGPFIVLKAEDELYPQCDLGEKLDGARESWKPWVAERAAKRLAESRAVDVHPAVWSHWEKIAKEGSTT